MAIEKVSDPVVFDTTGESAVERKKSRSIICLRWSLRRQILTVFVAINVVAAATALSLIVFNAKLAIELEVSSAVDGVERMVREIVSQPGNISSSLERLRNLPTTAGAFRHVSVSVIGPNDPRAALLPAPQPYSMTAVPHWFSSLLAVPEIRREMKVVANSRHIGSVVIVGNSADEIAEVWRDARDLAILAIILSVAVIVLFWFALGRVLKPLAGLASGLGHLERGNFGERLARPQVKELANIIDSFNTLAERLDLSKKYSRALSQKLVTAQDEERQSIATELHDEWGPCLFGIKANIASLELLIKDLPPKSRSAVQERLQVIAAIADRIQTMNRALLNKLSAVSIRHVSLADTISAVVADFRKAAPTTRFSVKLGRLDHDFDHATKTTIRRCLQESLTNALRHGHAKQVQIELAIADDPANPVNPILSLSVRDDGRGLAANVQLGLGLTSMTERVNALGGTIKVGPGGDGGTEVSINLPFSAADEATWPSKLGAASR